MDRRKILKSIGLASLVTLAYRNRAFALPLFSEGAEWARDIRFHSDQLIQGKTNSEDWQNEIERIFGDIEISELLTDLDFDAIRKSMFLNNDRETWLNTLIIGLTEKEKIHTKIVGLKKDRCIPPHGHENEVSVFLTLQGNFHLRQWDRIAVNPTSLDIKPAFDGLVDTGEWNSQSEQRTNVHWLHATSDEAYLLSVRVGKIDGTASGRSRIPIDPDSALDLGTGIFRAPILDQDTWWKRFH